MKSVAKCCLLTGFVLRFIVKQQLAAGTCQPFLQLEAHQSWC